ncbi:MAG: RNA polymerase sigma factor [Candidatus Aminicenantales bacterium]
MALENVVQECLEGKQEAWRTLVDTFSRRIFNMAYQFCGRREEAEDLTQEIFMKIYLSLSKFNPNKNLTAWVLTLAKNHLIDTYRKTKQERQQRQDFDENFQPGLEPGPEDKLMTEADRRLLWHGLDKLPAETRLAIILREIQGKSYEETADILGIPVGTVKSRINRGKLQLAQILRQGGEL